ASVVVAQVFACACTSSPLESGTLDHAPPGRSFGRELGELPPLPPRQQIPPKRRVLRDMPQEQLPLCPEGILIRLVVGNLLPAGEEIDRLGNVGIPHRLRRCGTWLDIAAPQAGNR